MLGMAYYNSGKYEQAQEAFDAAGRDERSKKYADQWVSYMNSELARQKSMQDEDTLQEETAQEETAQEG